MEDIYSKQLYKEVSDCDNALEIIYKKKLISNNRSMQEMFKFMQNNSIRLLYRHKEILLKEIKRINNNEILLITINNSLKRKNEGFNENEAIHALKNMKKTK